MQGLSGYPTKSEKRLQFWWTKTIWCSCHALTNPSRGCQLAFKHLTCLSVMDGHVINTIGSRGSALGQFSNPMGVSVDPPPRTPLGGRSKQPPCAAVHRGRTIHPTISLLPKPFLNGLPFQWGRRHPSLHDKQLHIHSPEGALRRSIGAFGSCYQLAVVPTPAEGEEDHLLVAGSGNNCVQIVSSTDGRVVRTLTTAEHPKGVTVTPDRYVIAVESSRHGVRACSPMGGLTGKCSWSV